MKRGLIFGSLLIAGGLLTGCGSTEGKSTAAEQLSISEAERLDEIENTEKTIKIPSTKEEMEIENKRREQERAEKLASRTVFHTDSGHEYYAIKDYYLELPEYKDIKEYTNHMPIYWKEQQSSFPDDKSQRSLSEAWAAMSTIKHINWFEEEIKELGLTEVFNEWQLVSYEFMKIDSGSPSSFEKHDELAVEYEKAMLKAVEAINNLKENK